MGDLRATMGPEVRASYGWTIRRPFDGRSDFFIFLEQLKFSLLAPVEPILVHLHLSYILFFVGLLDFLFNVNHTVAYVILALFADGMLTHYPHHHALDHAAILPQLAVPDPPIATLWLIMETTSLIGLCLRTRNDTVRTAIHERWAKIRNGMNEALESKVFEPTSHKAEINALQSTLKSLKKDDELQVFLDGLPGLLHGSAQIYSAKLEDRLEDLFKSAADKLLATCMTGLLTEGLRRQSLTHGLSGIYLVLSQYHRSPFWGRSETSGTT